MPLTISSNLTLLFRAPSYKANNSGCGDEAGNELSKDRRHNVGISPLF
jgi:hypothetical protein